MLDKYEDVDVPFFWFHSFKEFWVKYKVPFHAGSHHINAFAFLQFHGIFETSGEDL